MQDDARKLDQLLGMVAHETKYLQTTGHQLRSQVLINTPHERTQGGSAAQLVHLLGPQTYRQWPAVAWTVL